MKCHYEVMELPREATTDEIKKQYKKFSELIEKSGTYPELTNPDGSWYDAPFYRADPGMVWAALFLELPEK